MVMIGLGKVENTKPETILHMLDVMLKTNKPAEEKQNILKETYHIPTSEITKEDINKMYSLVQETYDKGYNSGYDTGYDSGMLATLKKLVDNGLLPLCTTAEQAKMSEEMFIQKTSKKN